MFNLASAAAAEPKREVHTTPEPPTGFQRLEFADIEAPRLTHYLFRFPAKFHPPVAHSLIRSYTSPGQTVFDPFCGSGTLLLAASVEGRNAIGSDVDPVAVFISEVRPIDFGLVTSVLPGNFCVPFWKLRLDLPESTVNSALRTSL